MALNTSLMGYWALEEASGNRADSIGANTLTDNNTVTQAVGRVGNAASFVAANTEYLSIIDNAALSIGPAQSFTIAAWVYMGDLTGIRAIVSKADLVATPEWRLWYDLSSNCFQFFLYDTGAGAGVNSTTAGAVASGVWYYIVAWYDAALNTMNIQVNNGAVDTQPGTTGGRDGASPFYIGALEALGPVLLMDGRIDEVGFWKRGLTATERTTLYNGGSGLAYSAGSWGADTVASRGRKWWWGGGM